ncbi:MAG: SecD/SecF fusion protein, partial [Urechidicola sp.]
MQNKGLIKLFAILFGIVSLYQLSFTALTNSVENDAEEFSILKADGDATLLNKYERIYLDSVANDSTILGRFTYNDIKDKSLNLGLDLKGGINAILQVSVRDILVGLSNNSKNPVFNEALENATAAQKNSDNTYTALFFEAFAKASAGKDIQLSDPSIFGNKSLSGKINFKNTNAEVEPVIEEEIDASISTAFQVLRSRIDKFGVTQPNIQRIGKSGRILIELPGAKDIDRIEKLITGTAKLQFWEAYANSDIQNFLIEADAKTAELFKDDAVEDSSATENLDDLLGAVTDSITTQKKQNRLFSFLGPNFAQTENQKSSFIGQAAIIDTARVNKFLGLKEVRSLLPSDMRYAKFLWDAKANGEVIGLYAIKSNREDIAPIEGDVIEDARQGFDQFGSNPEVSMSMNTYGSKLWAKLTTENANGGFVAVVLDNEVHSAPRVGDPILAGNTSISGGSMTIEEAEDLANILKAGKLPARAHIIQSAVVGASLGQKAIDSSFTSFGIALIL